MSTIQIGRVGMRVLLLYTALFGFSIGVAFSQMSFVALIFGLVFALWAFQIRRTSERITS